MEIKFKVDEVVSSEPVQNMIAVGKFKVAILTAILDRISAHLTPNEIETMIINAWLMRGELPSAKEVDELELFAIKATAIAED